MALHRLSRLGRSALIIRVWRQMPKQLRRVLGCTLERGHGGTPARLGHPVTRVIRPLLEHHIQKLLGALLELVRLATSPSKFLRRPLVRWRRRCRRRRVRRRRTRLRSVVCGVLVADTRRTLYMVNTKGVWTWLETSMTRGRKCRAKSFVLILIITAFSLSLGDMSQEETVLCSGNFAPL